MTARKIAIAALAAMMWTAPAQATGPVSFDGAWQQQTFPRLDANTYGFGGSSLTLRSDAAVSLVWRALDQTFWPARSATWRWSVTTGTPPTDLGRKGGDDRNMAIYFVFLPQDKAARAAGSGIGRLLRDRDARVLVYVWGGDHRRGQMLDSPYLGDRGKTVVLRRAGTGAHDEAVDLAADFTLAFGTAPQALVGLAVSGDSDDTNSRIDARLERLVLR